VKVLTRTLCMLPALLALPAAAQQPSEGLGDAVGAPEAALFSSAPSESERLSGVAK
jgi:hypothetical protein